MTPPDGGVPFGKIRKEWISHNHVPLSVKKSSTTGVADDCKMSLALSIFLLVFLTELITWIGQSVLLNFVSVQ